MSDELSFMGLGTREIDTSDKFEPLPADKYVVRVIETSTQATKNGLGNGCFLKLQVTEGIYKDRELRMYLLIQHQNTVAQELAIQKWEKIRQAVGLQTLTNTTQVVGKQFVVNVVVESVQDDNGNTKRRNNIEFYGAYNPQEMCTNPNTQGNIPPRFQSTVQEPQQPAPQAPAPNVNHSQPPDTYDQQAQVKPPWSQG